MSSKVALLHLAGCYPWLTLSRAYAVLCGITEHKIGCKDYGQRPQAPKL
jgi:hypothetical protein